MTRSSVFAQRVVLTLISTLLAVAPAVSGLEVYLRQLDVHQIRRVPVIEGDASIYFQCANEEQLFLPKVQTTNVEYYWNAGDLAVTSVPPRSCKACAFWEERKFPFRKDDILGLEFQVCEVDFAETGLAAKTAQDAFDATFECQECRAVPPAPAPPPPPAPAAPSGQDTQHRSGWLSAGGITAIVIIASISGILLGVIGFAVVQHMKARRRAQGLGSADKQSHYDVWQRTPLRQLIVPCRSRWLSAGGIAAIVIIASVSGILLGVFGFAVVQRAKARRRAQAEVAFEAAQSELGLDETFEQDTEAFHQSLLHPSAWYKLKDGPSNGD